MSLDVPCSLGEGMLSGDVVNGACTDDWFVGKLVRDDDLHGFRPGLHSDFSLSGQKLQYLP